MSRNFFNSVGSKSFQVEIFPGRSREDPETNPSRTRVEPETNPSRTPTFLTRNAIHVSLDILFRTVYLMTIFDLIPDCTVPISKSDHHVSSAAFDLARKITMCNSRYKMETTPSVPDNEVPTLRPVSPAPVWKNPSWNQRGKFLSSTKVKYYTLRELGEGGRGYTPRENGSES